MPEEQLTTLARALVLAGGIILLVAGMLRFTNGVVTAYLESPLALSRTQEGVLGIASGVIALAGYRPLDKIPWALLMIVLGIITGGLGGILVLVAGLVSLVVSHAETSVTSQPSA